VTKYQKSVEQHQKAISRLSDVANELSGVDIELQVCIDYTDASGPIGHPLTIAREQLGVAMNALQLVGYALSTSTQRLKDRESEDPSAHHAVDFVDSLPPA
jgi:hypothetical protein